MSTRVCGHYFFSPLLQGLFPFQQPHEQQLKLQRLFGVACKLSHCLQRPIQLPADTEEVLERMRLARPHNISYVRVVFPEPVCPTTIMTGYSSMQYRSSSPEKSALKKIRKKKHANTHGILQWEGVHVGLEVEGSCLMVRMGLHFLVPESACPDYSPVLPCQASKTPRKTSNLSRMC